jgi:phosphatidylglycerophosphate synthase
MMISKKIERLNLVFSFAMLLALGIDFYYLNLLIVPIVALLFFIVLGGIYFDEIKQLKPLGGYANWVTSFRLLNLFLIIVLYTHLTTLQLGLWSLMVVLLDGVDGYLARKFNHESNFGAQFDMETDSFFVAAISFTLYKLNLTEIWIIIPGFMRYIYLVLVFVLGLSKKEEILSKWSKHIAVLFFLSLISPFLLPVYLSTGLLIISSICIFYSFGFAFLKKL